MCLRKCRDCGLEAHTEEDLGFFCSNKKQKHGRDNLCNKCNANRAAEKRKVSGYKKDSHLKNRYGITLKDYNNMFKEQKGCCKICGTHQVETHTALHVDHCHTTGEVRGLLCHHCNTMLGLAKDNISILENAIEYLKESNNEKIQRCY